MKKIALSIIALCLFIPFVVDAEVNDEEIVAQTIKYYKTVTFNNNLCSVSLNSLCNNSITYEVSKEEFDNSSTEPIRDGLTETTYKRLTSTISTFSSYFKYSANLYWKQMPSTRSYDIIGIGHYGSVKNLGNNTYFEQHYTKSGTNYTTYTNYPQVFSNGSGTSFQLPSGTITALSQDFYFIVEKNTTSTIVTQLAAADYAHATSTISLNNSKKYWVDSLGITHNGNSPYYDAIDAANAYWSGTW